MIDAKILIADPDEQSLGHLRQVLEQAGYHVLATGSGSEAFALATAHQPKVCIIDPLVPDIDGFTLSRRLRLKYKEMRVVFSTATHKGENYRNDARTRYGASAYLEKPYRDADLVRIVGRLTGVIPAPTAPAKASAKPAAAPAAPPSAATKAFKKHDTLPGVPISSLELESTMEVSLASMNSQLEQMRSQFLLKPDAPKSLLDDLDLSDMDVDKSAETKSPGVAKAVPVSRETVERFERTVSEPDAHLDKTVADSFAKLERSAQEAANEKATAFKPADTLITSSPMGSHLLTAEDIFGGLIHDIEHGRPKPPPGARPFTEPSKLDDSTRADHLGDDTNPNAGAPEAPAHSPDRTDKYELLELIDEDQAFEIWKAKIKGEKGFERTMALKKIKSFLADNPELNALFLKEAKLAAALSHPNIVQIYELGEFQGVRFLAREFLQGESLKSVLNQCREKNATLPVAIVAHLGAKIADALAYAHGARGMDGQPLDIAHHHLSPDNIIITEEGEPKVLNFGTGQVAARAIGADNMSLEQLQSLAPEQVSGRKLDHRVDIFALGSLLYRALTGVDPFTGTGRESVMLRIREAESAPVSLVRQDIPQVLSDIIARAMHGDPERRYQLAADMARDLRSFLKNYGQRITDEDIAAYLRALRKGIVMEAPSTPPSTPPPEPEPAPLEVPPSSAIDAEILPPPRRRDSMPPTQLYQAPPPASGSGRLWLLVALLVVVLLAAVAWKFGYFSSSNSGSSQPATAATEAAEPAADQPLEAEPEAAPSEPPVASESAPPVSEPAAQTGDATGDGKLEQLSQELQRKEDELRRKKELLKQLDAEKAKNN